MKMKVFILFFLCHIIAKAQTSDSLLFQLNSISTLWAGVIPGLFLLYIFGMKRWYNIVISIALGKFWVRLKTTLRK